MVSDRAQQELQITNKRQAKDQEAWFKQLREEALPKEDNRPELPGRAAAKAKASREALEEARTILGDCNGTKIAVSHLEAIPNLEKWVEEKSHPGEANVAEVVYVQTEIADDLISVASTPNLPSLPGTSGSDEDDIEIITYSQVAATRGGPSNHSMMPFGVAINVEEEVETPLMPPNG
ncbi:hypothetical protein FOXYSP1_17145 [Fusarium oxysporum f. sp. phaseoli]